MLQPVHQGDVVADGAQTLLEVGESAPVAAVAKYRPALTALGPFRRKGRQIVGRGDEVFHGLLHLGEGTNRSVVLNQDGGEESAPGYQPLEFILGLRCTFGSLD
ncbi:unnamed protein product [Ectocarpus sp. 8 AP-2014]